MRQLLNTLYIQTQGSYLNLRTDNIQVEVDQKCKALIPLHHIGELAIFGNVLLSPFLVQRLGRERKSVSWLSEYGRFCARSEPVVSGNVILRVAQYKAAESLSSALAIAKYVVAGKLQNQRTTLLRSARDTKDNNVAQQLRQAAQHIANQITSLPSSQTLEQLRGIEGDAAKRYWQVFSLMLRANRDYFSISERSRRPARDPLNALLNFVYTILANDCASACQSVGLDPQVGFLHSLRSGRNSLALDMMEELRSTVADRAILTLINRQQLVPADFVRHQGDTYNISEEARKKILAYLTERKKEEVMHSFLGRKMPLGLVPHVQARLLAQHLRGDRDKYPPYLQR